MKNYATGTALVGWVCAGLAFGLTSIQPALAQEIVRAIVPASGNGAGIQAMAAEFNAIQSEVVVETTQLPPGDAYIQALMPVLQGGSADFDLIFTNTGTGNPDSVDNISRGGHLADLSDQPWAVNYPRDSGDFGILWTDDHLYAMPLSMISVGLAYNQSLLAQNNLEAPSTFDELLAFCDAAKEIGKRAIGLSGASSFYFYEITAANTVYLDNPDWNERRIAGEVTFSSDPGWRLALERIQAMIDRECFVEGVQSLMPPQMFASVAGEHVLMAVGPTSMVGAINNLRPDFDMRMRPLPGASIEETVAVGVFNDAVSLLERSPNKEAALKFLEWFAQPEQMVAYASVASGTPPQQFLDRDFPDDLADMAPFYEEGRYRKVPHHTWPSPAVRGALLQLGSAFLARAISIDDFLAELDAAWDRN